MEKMPEDIAERLLAIGKVEWGSTDALPDDGHVEHLTNSLRLTREDFGTEGNQPMHGVYLKGTETVLCHTGTSPNSGAHANIITGLWNHFVELAEAQRAQRDS